MGKMLIGGDWEGETPMRHCVDVVDVTPKAEMRPHHKSLANHNTVSESTVDRYCRAALQTIRAGQAGPAQGKFLPSPQLPIPDLQRPPAASFRSRGQLKPRGWLLHLNTRARLSRACYMSRYIQGMSCVERTHTFI